MVTAFDSADGEKRILIVAGNAALRQEAHAIFPARSGVLVVGEAEADTAAGAKPAQFRPAIALVDMTNSHGNSLQTVRQIKARNPGVKVLALVAGDRLPRSLSIFKAGLSGYVAKDSGLCSLGSAMEALDRGGIFVDPVAARKVMTDYLRQLRGEKEDKYRRLSQREREVLRLIGQGYATEEIAQALEVTPNTVFSYSPDL